MPTPNYGLKQYTSSSTETFGSMVDSVLGTDVNSNVNKIDAALGNKADKVIPVANGNIATLDANGNLLDGGVTVDKLQPAINEITADVSINDGDYVPLYDTGTSTHKKSLWSNIIAKIRAVLFGTSNGILKANGSGVISTATAGTDYAEADHGHSADDITDGVTNKVYTAEEKEKLAEIGVVSYYGTCTTSAGTAAKTTTITGFAAAQLEAGAVVWVKFTNTNTSTSATLNVSSTGAKPIRANGITPLSEQIAAGMDAIFQYDGAYWNHLNPIPVDRLALSGGTMTGGMAMGNNKITGLGTPTAETDAANKSYVDSKSSGITVDSAIASDGTNPVTGGAIYTALQEKVPTTRTINSKELSSNISLLASDVSAVPTDSNSKADPAYTSAFINTVTVNTTLALSHAGTFIMVNSASARTITVPANSSVAFPVGTEIEVLRYGAGTVTIVPASGVNFVAYGSPSTYTISGTYGVVVLKQISANTWLLTGALS